MPLKGVVRTVALEGSPAELSGLADHIVPTGAVDMQATVHAAATAAALTGGGEIMICKPHVPYWQNRPIVIVDDNIKLHCEPGTRINRDSTWNAATNPYAQPYGLPHPLDASLIFLGVDDGDAVGFEFDHRTGGTHGNGIARLPRVSAGYYTDDNGRPCRGGVVSACKVWGIPIHSYMYWNVRAEEARWTGNRAYCGMTDTRVEASTEAYETFGGRNVTWDRNYAYGASGYAFLAWAGGEHFAPADWRLEGITYDGNEAEFCRGFMAFYPFRCPIAGPQHAREVSFINNKGRDIATIGLYFEANDRTGHVFPAVVTARKQMLHDIRFQGNDCRFLPLDEGPMTARASAISVGGVARAVQIRNWLGDGLDVRNFKMLGDTYDGSPCLDASGHGNFLGLPGLQLEAVNIVSRQTAGVAPGVNASSCQGFSMKSGLVKGARRVGIELQACNEAKIEGVDVRDWNLDGSGSPGISRGSCSDTEIHDNTFQTSVLTGDPALVKALDLGPGFGARNRASNNNLLGGNYARNVWP